MLTSVVVGIALAPTAREPLRQVQGAMLIAGHGLEGDRYGRGLGTYQDGELGKRQVTLIDRRHLKAGGYTLEESRRNLEVVGNVDLMRLFTASGGLFFKLGDATCRGVKYCDPCNIPSKLVGRTGSFRKDMWGCGGLIIEVIQSGRIWVGCRLEAAIKMYD